MAKRGPGTPAGRQRAALNALSHGALARTPVIPGVEDEGAWTSHLQGFRDSLAPTSSFEEFLVDRIAQTAWRLKRIEFYEDQMLSLAQASAEELAVARILFPHGGSVNLAGKPAATVVGEAIARLRLLDELLMRLQSHGAANIDLSREELDLLHDGINLVLASRGTQSDALRRQLVNDIASDESAPDARLSANVAAVLADIRPLIDRRSPEQDLAPRDRPEFAALVRDYPVALVLLSLRAEMQRLQREAAGLDATIERIRRESLLLEAGTLNTLTRYEAHLRRQFVQYLGQLDGSRSRRAGALDAAASRLIGPPRTAE